MLGIVNLYVTTADVLIAEEQQLDVECLKYSSDGGRTWIDYQSFDYLWGSIYTLNAFGVNINTGSVFAGYGFIFPVKNQKLIRNSSSNPDYWTALPPIGPLIDHHGDYVGTDTAPVTAITSRPMGDMFVGLGDGCGVWRSTDDGQSFTDVSLGLESKDVNALVAAPDGHIYAGTAAGIFRSTDQVPVELSEFSVE